MDRGEFKIAKRLRDEFSRSGTKKGAK